MSVLKIFRVNSSKSDRTAIKLLRSQELLLKFYFVLVMIFLSPHCDNCCLLAGVRWFWKWRMMGEIEGSYRALQTPGTRLGTKFNAGISTLEPGQSLSGNMVGGSRSHTRGKQIRVQWLDDSEEFFDVNVSFIHAFFLFVTINVKGLVHCKNYLTL